MSVCTPIGIGDVGRHNTLIVKVVTLKERAYPSKYPPNCQLSPQFLFVGSQSVLPPFTDIDMMSPEPPTL